MQDGAAASESSSRRRSGRRRTRPDRSRPRARSGAAPSPRAAPGRATRASAPDSGPRSAGSSIRCGRRARGRRAGRGSSRGSGPTAERPARARSRDVRAAGRADRDGGHVPASNGRQSGAAIRAARRPGRRARGRCGRLPAGDRRCAAAASVRPARQRSPLGDLVEGQRFFVDRPGREVPFGDEDELARHVGRAVPDAGVALFIGGGHFLDDALELGGNGE